MSLEEPTATTTSILSQDQIDRYLRDGVLVVENVLTERELTAARLGLAETLQRHGIGPSNLKETGHHLASLSSTGGAGGVLDVFYEDWKVVVATNERLYRITTELWQTAYSWDADDQAQQQQIEVQQDDSQQSWKWHPFGAFDCRKAYLYLDRIGYRLPTILAEQLGKKIASDNTSNEKKSNRRPTTAPIQRSLTPHLDCCPETFYDTTQNQSKWRPIQCFVSLSDTLEPNHGGLEVAPGFHREFAAWAQNRPPTVVTKKKKKQQQQKQRRKEDNSGDDSKETDNSEYETIRMPAPCLGQYTHIRPTEDAAIIRRIQHVPVPAGSAVFWDTRLPHANAYYHRGASPRAVVYCSFLPADVPVNRRYAARQWQRWKAGRPPTDQWIQTDNDNGDENRGDDDDDDENPSNRDPVLHQSLQAALATPLSRKLVGAEPW